MPASVLLALLVATCLLALTPALVRRYDPDERMIADRAASDARVLAREAHQPSRPGAHPSSAFDSDETGISAENPGDPGTDSLPQKALGPRAWERRGTRRGDSVRLGPDLSVTGEDPEMSETARLRAQRADWWRRRHRRILYVLLILTLLELLGVIIAGPGFWFGASASIVLVGAYVYFLRARARRIVRSKAAHPARAAITAAPESAYDPSPVPTYVPEQPFPEEEALREEEPPAEDHRESYLFENGSLHESEEPEPVRRQDPRRVEGPGVRGRSYESPAKLERLCLSRLTSSATS